MEFGLTFYVVAALVVFLTGISKAGFGAGVEMMAVPVMALLISPVAAAGIMLPILLAIDAANLWRYRADWQRSMVFVLLPAALIGIVIGTMTFQFLSQEWIRLGLGVLTLAFVAQRMLVPADGPGASFSRPVTVALASLGGFTSFVAHAGGPPLKMILLSHNLPSRQFVATNSYLFATINALKIVPYIWLGQFSVQNMATSLSLAPFVLLGVPIGFWLNGVVTQVWFNRIIFGALIIAGIKLVWDGSVVLIS
ncbi:MAG: sulfite exporter TauE/SafE family protein [Rhizobiaceae bacterium]